jgi:hypothetical protein
MLTTQQLDAYPGTGRLVNDSSSIVSTTVGDGDESGMLPISMAQMRSLWVILHRAGLGLKQEC